MDYFDIDGRLAEYYSASRWAGDRPVIGITANYEGGNASLNEHYYNMVCAGGGVPLLLPPVADAALISGMLDSVDGLLLSGGGDYNPLWSGEEPQPGLGGVNATRDLPELLTVRMAYHRQIPMLGICRGIQTLAVALGGHVAQDIHPGTKHAQTADRWLPTHSVELQADSTLAMVYGQTRLRVNSFHHQAVDRTGEKFCVAATATDGTIEAMESSEEKAIMGVQWHPEWLGEDGTRLARWLADAAMAYRHAKRLHATMLTLDSHTDTPMFFPAGANFCQRDSRIRTDLHKMADGRLDATTMVAYLPQPGEGQNFRDVAPYPVEGPRAYADLIFDKIEAQVGESAGRIRLATTPDELYANKQAGVKSVMLGIENGLALEHDLANVAHFAGRGAVYITLCHNGDNDICDSARGCATHDGVSEWGEQVIAEMNRQGLMVDLSHASEKSFYDALALSDTPIVCSHSCCRSLCDVPRNLTDDQLRALARRGGVAQMTLYPGFLCQGGEATILDMIDHIDHAVEIMGAEHVGVGTDFDGDGGVPGLSDASEALRLTILLMRRRYSDDDIARIWGGNWLRVMRQVQEWS